MPVHLAYDRSFANDEAMDGFRDTKGCRQSSEPVFHHLEPVCCCERCYACLAHPLIAKISADEDLLVPEDLARQWLSLCSCSSCGYDKCHDQLFEQSSFIMIDPAAAESHTKISPGSTMTCSGSLLRNSKGVASRRPLRNIQQDVLNNDFKKKSSNVCCFAEDNNCSWIQAPPNRTICHIVDDVTFDRLTAASPVLTRCCITGRKQNTSRHLGKFKAKNECVSR